MRRIIEWIEDDMMFNGVEVSDIVIIALVEIATILTIFFVVACVIFRVEGLGTVSSVNATAINTITTVRNISTF